MIPFTWFNWHEPVITPAQGAWIFLGCLFVYIAARSIAWFMSDEFLPDPEPEDPMSQPNGDVPHVGGQS